MTIFLFAEEHSLDSWPQALVNEQDYLDHWHMNDCDYMVQVVHYLLMQESGAVQKHFK